VPTKTTMNVFKYLHFLIFDKLKEEESDVTIPDKIEESKSFLEDDVD
jgi:hypothetical protein